MSNETGLTDPKQPQTEEEAQLIFEEVYKSKVAGKTPDNRQVSRVLNEYRKETEPEAASQQDDQQEQQTAEEEEVESTDQQAQVTPPEAEGTAQSEVQVKPEDLDAVRRELEQWKQKAKSLDGREAARQRQIAELEAKLRNQQKQPEKPQTPTEKDPEWEEFVQADPALAKLIEKREKQLKDNLAKELEERLATHVEPIYRQQQEDFATKEQNKLREWVPNFDEVLESEQYAQWFYAQPTYIQNLASESAKDALFVIQKYAHDMSLIYGQAPPKEPAKPQEPVKPDEKVAKLQEQREKRVAATGVGPKQATTPKTDDLDPEALFKRVYDEKIKQYRR